MASYKLNEILALFILAEQLNGQEVVVYKMGSKWSNVLSDYGRKQHLDQ